MRWLPSGQLMQIRWLRSALRNLDEEAEFIASEDARMATLVVARVIHSVALLATQPGLGRPGRVAGTRELLVPKTRYLVPYRACAWRHGRNPARFPHIAPAAAALVSAEVDVNCHLVTGLTDPGSTE